MVKVFAGVRGQFLQKEPPTISAERSSLPKKELSAIFPEEIRHFFWQLL
jgi:hypothetical protein